MASYPKKKCGILGATGSVGQRFILLLADHPFLELHAIGASNRSAGKKYKDAVRWKQTTAMSERLSNLVLRDCRADQFSDCDLVFSGLNSDVAGEIEMEFIKAEIPVFSNAKNYRKHPLVPLVVPTVNPNHLDLIPHQRKEFGLKKGFLVCNSNCAVIGVVIPFAALQAKFGPVEDVEVFTEQAVSGAGYPGVPSMDIMDNVIPYISGEEDKLENEAQKILGSLNADATAFDEQKGLTVGATCTRVGVTDGHMAFVSLRFKNRPGPNAEEVKQAMREYQSEAQKLGCPSAPQEAIKVFDEPDRPQPRLDRDISKGYTVSVGRVREAASGSHFDLRFAALSHNTVIGAAVDKAVKMPRGPKKHQKRLSAPSHWLLDKMSGTYAPKASPGPHKLRDCLPLIVFIRNRLKYALNGRETKAIMMQRLIKVDGKVRTDPTYPAGFMDVIGIEKTGENFRLIYDTKGRFTVHRIQAEEAEYKLCKVKRVQLGKGGIPFLVTHDARTIRYPDPAIKVNDTVKVDIATGKITEFVRFDTGVVCMVTGGRNMGRVGVITHRERHDGGFNIVHIKDAIDNSFATRESNVFVIGQEKPWISLPKGKGVKLTIAEERDRRRAYTIAN
ncbi:hypothetical protein CNMCM5623_010094 [Aspergillus felis]|uniref:Aspartate-semialdehyde dehydrogenase n=1 Tax=Aspergillus felis TaxID=1287682 RepID=A0A8H6PLZ2_9EURO|nr:hypothetical protein CNMCM5623_010094 [Aspergillus felis]KAF7179771.1 hypothetical protein CNMCM7691_008821 [Aspergillus felis]